ncbi:MAG: hypothetical protein Q9227_000627 [Pyrenula ochraceoflavens]
MDAATSGSDSVPGSPKLKKARRRRSGWFSKSGSPPSGQVTREDPPAWIAGHFETVPYNLDPLINGEKVSELWKEDGDTLVHLFPRASEKEASFKVDSTLLADSHELMQLCTILGTMSPPRVQSPPLGHANVRNLEDMAQRMAINDFRSPTSHIKWTSTDSDRNSTASLRLERDFNGGLDQPMLRELYLPLAFEGDVSAQATYTNEDLERLVSYRNFFAFLSGERLVATRRQRTPFRIFWSLCKILQRFNFSNLDGSTLGEIPTDRIAEYAQKFKLYDVRSSPEKVIEALVLGEQMKFTPLFNSAYIHAVGDLELITALNSPRWDLISESTRHELERASFDLAKRIQSTSMRLRDLEFHVLWTGLAKSTSDKEYKTLDFKAWRSSFNAFRSHVISFYSSRYKSWPPKKGFNRQNLKEIYDDFSALYDLLVDRNAQTTRSSDPRANLRANEDDNSPLAHKALRQILAEYDASVAPLQPPVPFDVPLLPQVEQRSLLQKKRLTSNEISNSLTTTSYNRDSLAAIARNEFVESFTKFERKTDGHIENLLSARMGQWILLYAIMQSLPLLVVDAPGVEATEGVSYFLCVGPKSGTGAGSTSQAAGVDEIFRRSHCWERAREWGMTAVENTMPPALAPPPKLGVGAADGYGGSLGVPKVRSNARVDRPLSTANFDDILRGASPKR